MDISSEALHVARRNADAHAVGNRIEWLLGDGFADFSAGGPLSGRKFDRILTNPPYIPTDEIASLDAEVRDFDPHLALDGGPDGLDFYRVLADRGSVLLNPGGMLIAEFGDGQENVLERLFTTAAWNSLRFEKDLSGRNRILIVSCMDPRSR